MGLQVTRAPRCRNIHDNEEGDSLQGNLICDRRSPNVPVAPAPAPTADPTPNPISLGADPTPRTEGGGYLSKNRRSCDCNHGCAVDLTIILRDGKVLAQGRPFF